MLTRSTYHKIPTSSNGTTVDGYLVGIVNTSDYSPFGVQLDGRTVSEGRYRYAFNGMEKDDEVKGSGNSYTTHFRQLDPRVGRWLSVDPKRTAWESPYVSMGNNPVLSNDKLGDVYKGANKKSARRTRKLIRKTFSGKENRELRKLFKLDKDKLTFKQIDEDKLEKATKHLSPEGRALANGYAGLINSDVMNYSLVVRRGERLITEQRTGMNDDVWLTLEYMRKDKLLNNHPSPNDGNAGYMGSDIDREGYGGITTSTVMEGAQLSATVMNPKSQLKIKKMVEVNGTLKPTNIDVMHTSSPMEILAHESIGHAYLRSSNREAVIVSNLYMKYKGILKYRNGTFHGMGKSEKLSRYELFEIPWNIDY